MIGEDRRQLNDRFVRVFKLLEDRGEVVKNDRHGKGMGDFAEKILGNRAYGHIVRAFLNPEDNRCIDYKHARILCREYGINETYMFDGMGSPFGMDLPKAKDIPPELLNGNILFTSVEAFAGATVEPDSFAREDLEYFSIPGLSGSGLVAFPIHGNSMEPVIHNGDVVICKEIDGYSDLKENKIYAVRNNGQLWVKYVQTIKDDKSRVRRLKLISANHLEHDPFEEEVNEYTRLYQVIRRISDL